MSYSTNYSDISDGLTRVRARFAEESQIRQDRLLILVSQLQDASAAPAALVEIGEINHKIAGTAATLGYPDLGAGAAEVDEMIHQSTLVNPELLIKIDNVISKLEDVQTSK
ncbi:Hpt domain-containing protein [Roseovarius aestuarii]|nr:Hpt domain-containing protein [Roseovarius aestuarii]